MAGDSSFDLARLLQPITPATFFNEFWEERPLHVSRNCRDYYVSLLTLDQIDPLITVLPPETVVLVNADSPIEVGDIARADTAAADSSLDVIKACQLFNAGATISVREAHKLIKSLATMCRVLEREFGAPFQANLYVTPAHGKGFDTHYDTHDTILLQLAGSKDWTIFDSPLRLPLNGQHFDRDLHKVGAPTMSCVLQAGDALYIPRGFLHHGRSQDETSLHATLGILSYRWSDVLLEAMAQLCFSDPEFRRALPLGLGQPSFDMTAARQTFAELLSRAVKEASADSVLERLADEFVVSRRALVPGQFAQMAQLQDLSINDEVGMRPAAIYRLQRQEETMQIRSHGREINLPVEAGDTIVFALQHKRYRVRDLPGDLSDDDKLTIVRRLIEEGLVWKLSVP